jgi:hypothetical protein
MKIIGKPYSGKPDVRFDEGELEIEPSAATPALDSTAIRYLSFRVVLPLVVFQFLPFCATFQTQISKSG